jgi:hypothetical protein
MNFKKYNFEDKTKVQDEGVENELPQVDSVFSDDENQGVGQNSSESDDDKNEFYDDDDQDFQETQINEPSQTATSNYKPQYQQI